MELYTRILLPKARFSFSYEDRVVMMGSCFAENIGRKLEENKFSVDINPFGTLYNPASVAEGLRMLLRPERFTPGDLFQHEGIYHSFTHHSRFSAPSEEECLGHINSRLSESSDFLRKATRLVISPIRHWKDGAHENQLSKATLLLATDALQKDYPDRIAYFPAYEILMDELRDYRFYADDMLHPSPLAIDYIWQRFIENFLSTDTSAILKEWGDIQKAINHKPFQPDSEAYKRFILQTLLKMERISEKIPSFDIRKEIEIVKSKLK